MHCKDVYWTGDKVIKATDRFKIFVAIENGIVTGYIDVTGMMFALMNIPSPERQFVRRFIMSSHITVKGGFRDNSFEIYIERS